MPLRDADIKILRHQYPWPEHRPKLDSAEWILDGGGKHMVVSVMPKDCPVLVLEIGTFLGASLKCWLNASPDVYVIAIDPWAGKWWESYAIEKGRAALAQQFAIENGPYLTFLASLWPCRERVFPVRGESPDKLYEISRLGIAPDLVYFDSNKTGEDIEVVHQLFPEAVLTGDDWTWGPEQGYPIRKAVKAFAAKHGYRYVADRATWMLVNRALEPHEHLSNFFSLLRDIARAIRTGLPWKS